MGFVEARATLGHHSLGRHSLGHHPMTARDYIWLAVLGAVERAPQSMEDVERAVAALSGPAWTPVTQLIYDAVDEMLEDGLLDPVERSLRLGITGEGRRRLHELIGLPLAAPLSTFGQVGVRLKLAFLDLVPQAVRRRQIDTILRACDCEIAARAASCPAWALNGPLGRAWLDHQVDALEETAAFLRRLSREEIPARP